MSVGIMVNDMLSVARLPSA